MMGYDVGYRLGGTTRYRFVQGGSVPLNGILSQGLFGMLILQPCLVVKFSCYTF